MTETVLEELYRLYRKEPKTKTKLIEPNGIYFVLPFFFFILVLHVGVLKKSNINE